MKTTPDRGLSTAERRETIKTAMAAAEALAAAGTPSLLMLPRDLSAEDLEYLGLSPEQGKSAKRGTV